MKKILITIILIAIAVPSYAQLFSTSRVSNEGMYLLANIGIMPMYDISGSGYDISTNGLGNNGTFFGGTFGYFANSIAYEISYNYNNYFMTSTLSVNDTSLGSKYEVSSQDIKIYVLIQPTSLSRSGSAVTPYIGVGGVYSKLNIDIDVPNIAKAKSDHEAYGLAGKVGVRLMMSMMMADIGLEYEHKPFSGGLTENTIKAIFGIGIKF